MMTWCSYLFGNPNSELMEKLFQVHDYLLLILLSILIFVLFELLYIFFCNFFNFFFLEDESLELIWTIVPFFLISSLIFPSLLSLYMLDVCNFCGCFLKIMGHQWYWSYMISEPEDYFFDSYMLPSSESFIRLLDVDNRLILPTSVPIRCFLSSSDVIHSWTIPSLGVKMDAIPGRLNQFCFSGLRSGVYFGQCSEICGANHSFMPIVLEFGH